MAEVTMSDVRIRYAIGRQSRLEIYSYWTVTHVWNQWATEWGSVRPGDTLSFEASLDVSGVPVRVVDEGTRSMDILLRWSHLATGVTYGGQVEDLRLISEYPAGHSVGQVLTWRVTGALPAPLCARCQRKRYRHYNKRVSDELLTCEQWCRPVVEGGS